MNVSQPRHTNIQYEKELTDLRTGLLRMAALVERQIAAAIGSLVNRNTSQARETISHDVEVNRMDIEIDERCIRLLALYQPAASDLRFITTGLKITADLERIGDNAVNVCYRVLDLNQTRQGAPNMGIPKLAGIAQSMVRDCIDAFVRGDVDLAKAVIARDDEVDELDDEISIELLGYMAREPRSIAQGAGILFVLKNLERIADHATNIAEMVVFLVKGKLVRHMDKKKQTRGDHSSGVKVRSSKTP